MQVNYPSFGGAAAAGSQSAAKMMKTGVARWALLIDASHLSAVKDLSTLVGNTRASLTQAGQQFLAALPELTIHKRANVPLDRRIASAALQLGGAIVEVPEDALAAGSHVADALARLLDETAEGLPLAAIALFPSEGVAPEPLASLFPAAVAGGAALALVTSPVCPLRLVHAAITAGATVLPAGALMTPQVLGAPGRVAARALLCGEGEALEPVLARPSSGPGRVVTLWDLQNQMLPKDATLPDVLGRLEGYLTQEGFLAPGASHTVTAFFHCRNDFYTVPPALIDAFYTADVELLEVGGDDEAADHAIRQQLTRILRAHRTGRAPLAAVVLVTGDGDHCSDLLRIARAGIVPVLVHPLNIAGGTLKDLAYAVGRALPFAELLGGGSAATTTTTGETIAARTKTTRTSTDLRPPQVAPHAAPTPTPVPPPASSSWKPPMPPPSAPPRFSPTLSTGSEDGWAPPSLSSFPSQTGSRKHSESSDGDGSSESDSFAALLRGVSLGGAPLHPPHHAAHAAGATHGQAAAARVLQQAQAAARAAHAAASSAARSGLSDSPRSFYGRGFLSSPELDDTAFDSDGGSDGFPSAPAHITRMLSFASLLDA